MRNWCVTQSWEIKLAFDRPGERSLNSRNNPIQWANYKMQQIASKFMTVFLGGRNSSFCTAMFVIVTIHFAEGCCIRPRGIPFLSLFLHFCTLHTIQWIVANVSATFRFRYNGRKWWILQWRVRLKNFPNKLKMYVVLVNGEKMTLIFYMHDACTYSSYTLECRWHLLNCKWK